MNLNLMNRVAIFIDGSDFYFGLKRNNRVNRVDYHQLSQALCGDDRKLVRTFYYNAVYDQHQFPDKAKVQRPFYDALERTPYLVLRLGKLIPTSTGDTMVRGVEPMLTADIIHYAHLNHFDTAIVITENPEFAIALKTVKETGKHVELGLFNDVKPGDLIRAADRVLNLDEILSIHNSKVFPPAPQEDFESSQPKSNASTSTTPTTPARRESTRESSRESKNSSKDYDNVQPNSNASHLPFLNKR
jgi:uncharacterized LabA/DUF88 family protein